MDERVRERIIAEARGNPLALLELPRDPAAAEGGFGRPDARAPSGHIEQSFVRRVQSLPMPTQKLLLAAAAEPVGDKALLIRAARRMGITPDVAAHAEAEGLIEIGTRVRFRHPADALGRLSRRRHRRPPARLTALSPRRPIRSPIRIVVRGMVPTPPSAPMTRWPTNSNGRPTGPRRGVASPPRRRSWSGRRS